MREPIGILVMRMLWFKPTLLGPKSSDVIETAAANMNPELRPTSAVPACSDIEVPEAASKMKAMGVGSRAMANHPVLAKYTFLHIKEILLGIVV